MKGINGNFSIEKCTIFIFPLVIKKIQQKKIYVIFEKIVIQQIFLKLMKNMLMDNTIGIIAHERTIINYSIYSTTKRKVFDDKYYPQGDTEQTVYRYRKQRYRITVI